MPRIETVPDPGRGAPFEASSVAKFVLTFLALLFYQTFSGWYPSASFVALAALAFVAGGVVVGIIVLSPGPAATTVEKERHATELARQRQADEARLQRVREFFRRTPHYARTLRKVRDRSVYRDEFGDWVVTRWLDRLTVFIQNKMGDVFPGRLDHETAQAFLDVVHRVLEEAWAADVTSPDDDRDAPLQGHDLNAFEENCAAMFRSSGFEVRLADASGHTGGDFLAMFMDARLVVQCSRSCSAAGRQAVQEAAEARRFYDAQSAMVISPQGFTASARQLARRAAVMLVDARDLPAFLGRVRSRTDATSGQCISDCEPDLELAGVR